MVHAISSAEFSGATLPPHESETPRMATLRTVASANTRPTPPAGKAGKIVLPTMEGLCFEKVKHIAYLEANGNYTVLHFTDGRQVLVCKTLGDVENLLPGAAFVRIHRSHTVHLRHLKKYVRGKGGHVLLQNGVTLTVSAGQKDDFMHAIKHYYG
ncbi:MAG: LytTR family transcriptional regulator [Saprospiraceae bacterium]|nr:LytTR family transcriptional regulator [Saprospiraceae bacterium]